MTLPPSSFGDDARFLARIEAIRTLSAQDARIDALQDLASEVHAHPRDLMLFVDATARSDDAAAKALAIKYGGSLRRERPSEWNAPPSIQAPPKHKMPHASAHWNLGTAATRPKTTGPKVSELAHEMAEGKGLTYSLARTQETTSTAAITQKLGVPAGTCLRLDDVLNLLLSEGGSALTSQFHRHMMDHNPDYDHPIDKLASRDRKPVDPLTREMSSYYVAQRYNGELRDRLSPIAVETLIPHAVVSALAGVATQEGIVHLGQALETFGPNAAELLVSLSKATEHGEKPIATSRRGVKYRYLPTGMLEMVSRSARTPDLDRRMGGFWSVVDQFGSPEVLKDVILGRSGHLVDSSDALSRALVASGAEPGAQRGKHYSAHPDAIAREQVRGFAKNTLYLKDHDVQADNVLNPDYAFWRDLALRIKGSAHPKTLLVYDDGFAMLQMFHELGERIDHLTPNIACVEQTERGALNCEAMERAGLPLKLNPTNMPRSWLKKMIEGPAIGECVAWHIERMLFEANPELRIEPKKAAVVGYGAVGRATAAALRKRGYEVEVYDHDPKAMLLAHKDGYGVGGIDPKLLSNASKDTLTPEAKASLEAAREKVFAKGHLAVDCTPGPGWQRGEFDLFPDKAVFANAGSGTLWGEQKPPLELPEPKGIMGFRRAEADGENIDGNAKTTELRALLGYMTLPEDRDLHSDDPKERVDNRGLRKTSFKGAEITSGDLAGRETNYHRVVRDEGGKERLMLYGGSVVNLKYGLPPEYVQVTYSLLYVAGLLAVENMAGDPPGWHEIPDATQKKMRDLIEADLKKRGLSLMNPDFNKTPPIIS